MNTVRFTGAVILLTTFCLLLSGCYREKRTATAETYEGYNLVEGCLVMDMQGKVVKKFPGWLCQFIESTGNIVATENFDNIMCYDKTLQVKWKKNIPFHHDLRLTENGEIYFLSFDEHPYMNKTVRFDVIYKLSKEGEVLYKWSCYDHIPQMLKYFSKAPHVKGKAPVYDGSQLADSFIAQHEKLFVRYEPSHPPLMKDYWSLSFINSLQPLPVNASEYKGAAFSKGNLLVSFYTYSFLAIIDPKTSEVLWTYYLDVNAKIHNASMLPNGNILMYVNSNYEDRRYVTILEIDPVTNKEVWKYEATPREAMNSVRLGSAQRLPNGNTLITDNTNDTARIFEVTKNKQIVWDWKINEAVSKRGNPLERMIYQARREPKNKIDKFLK